MALGGFVNTYHAYIFGTSLWYFVRGVVRIVDPVLVISWFRPPIIKHLMPNDLEIYNVRNDAWGLLAIAGLLIVLTDAVPLPASIVGSTFVDSTPARYKKPYARAAIIITLFHHVATMIGAYEHWRLPTHHTGGMDIGVYGNIFFTALGISALAFGPPAPQTEDAVEKHK